MFRIADRIVISASDNATLNLGQAPLSIIGAPLDNVLPAATIEALIAGTREARKEYDDDRARFEQGDVSLSEVQRRRIEALQLGDVHDVMIGGLHFHQALEVNHRNLCLVAHIPTLTPDWSVPRHTLGASARRRVVACAHRRAALCWSHCAA